MSWYERISYGVIAVAFLGFIIGIVGLLRMRGSRDDPKR